MRLGSMFRLRIRSLFRWTQVEEELDEELRYHVEREIEEKMAAGMSCEDARRAAIRDFVGSQQRKRSVAICGD